MTRPAMPVPAKDPLLAPYLARIVDAIDAIDPEASATRASSSRRVRELRIEPWEVSAYRKLSGIRVPGPRDREDVLQLYVAAAALRLRIDEEARELAQFAAQETPPALMADIHDTLDRARDLDALFGEFLSEGDFRPDAREIDQLFRSRFRLLRGFSGLWLLFDERRRGAK